LSQPTAEARVVEAAVVAQRIEQWHVWIHVDLMRSTVHIKQHLLSMTRTSLMGETKVTHSVAHRSYG
jgi:nicotinamide riboside transporter PnuC